MQTGEVKSSAAPLTLKGRMYTALVLRPGSSDPAVFGPAFSEKVRSAPGLFARAPVVIDPCDLPAGTAAQALQGLVEQIREAGCVPYAIQTPDEAVAESARALGLAVYPEAPETGRPEAPGGAEPEAAAPASGTAMVVERNVRSGQRVYAQGRDLVVAGSVSAGAEVLADGHVHIYGSLRGRALAGLQGDESARIFCLRFAAELIAVAGVYRTLEEGTGELPGGPVQIRLRGDALEVDAL